VNGYLARRIVPTVALAAAVGACIVLLLLVLRFAPALASSSVAPADVLPIFAWALVPAIGVALGPAVLLGGVLALGRMRADGEIGAWASLGAGPRRLARVPLAASAAVLALGMFLSLGAEPRAVRSIHRGLGRALSAGVARAIEGAPAGRWTAPLPGVEVWVSRQAVDGARDLVVDAGGTVLAASGGRAKSAKGAVVLSLENARVREGPSLRLAAEHLDVAIPVGNLVRLAEDAAPRALARSSASLLATEGAPARRALARRLAAPALAAAFALWTIPLGLFPFARGRALALAALVVGAGHVVFRLSETFASPFAWGLAPLAVSLGAIASAGAYRSRSPA